MNPWERFINTIQRKEVDHIPVALLGTPRFFASLGGEELFECMYNPKKLMDVELRAFKKFPEVLFIPGCWPDYGSGEISAFGGRVSWSENSMPQIRECYIKSDSNIHHLTIPDPKSDGLMPWHLETLKLFVKRKEEFGDNFHFIHSSGPGELAVDLWGMQNLLMNIHLKPDLIKELFRKLTEFILIWLEAQIEILNSAQGILFTDDISGLVSPESYKEFFFPYHCYIREKFKNYIFVFHCDTKSDHILEFLPQIGVDVFNLGPTTELARATATIGDKVCLMGNLDPVGVMQSNDTNYVKKSARQCLADAGDKRGFILSAGGGMNENTSAENIDILIEISHTN